MTATQLPLLLPGWEREPCGDAERERAFLDLHGPGHRRHATVLWDHARSAARRDVAWGRPVHTVVLAGGCWL